MRLKAEYSVSNPSAYIWANGQNLPSALQHRDLAHLLSIHPMRVPIRGQSPDWVALYLKRERERAWQPRVRLPDYDEIIYWSSHCGLGATQASELPHSNLSVLLSQVSIRRQNPDLSSSVRRRRPCHPLFEDRGFVLSRAWDWVCRKFLTLLEFFI